MPAILPADRIKSGDPRTLRIKSGTLAGIQEAVFKIGPANANGIPSGETLVTKTLSGGDISVVTVNGGDALSIPLSEADTELLSGFQAHETEIFDSDGVKKTLMYGDNYFGVLYFERDYQ